MLAAYHSDALYEDLKDGIPALVILLEDEEDRVGPNAAAALGNLVRNGDQLLQGLIDAGALHVRRFFLFKILSSAAGGKQYFAALLVLVFPEGAPGL